MNGEMTQPVRPRSTHELSAPTVDLVTGKCNPGKMIRTVAASPLTVDRIISCKPEPDCVQHGINADVLPPTDNVGMSATDISVSARVVTAPVLGESDGKLMSKKSPAGDLSESSELLPSFGWSSSSPSPTLPWGTAENSSPPFSPNRVRKGQSQISPSEGSLFNVSPMSPIKPNRENGLPQPSGMLLPTILDEFNDSVLGEPISYARLEEAPGSESPHLLPVYAWPPRATFMRDPIIQTVLAPLKRDVLPAGAPWPVPPEVAEKARMTDSGIPGCPEAAAVAEVAAVAGAVCRGKSVTYVPMSSALGGSRLWSTDSVSPSPAAVTVSRPLIPPASEPGSSTVVSTRRSMSSN